jgi:hypothetical protein
MASLSQAVMETEVPATQLLQLLPSLLEGDLLEGSPGLLRRKWKTAPASFAVRNNVLLRIDRSKSSVTVVARLTEYNTTLESPEVFVLEPKTGSRSAPLFFSAKDSQHAAAAWVAAIVEAAVEDPTMDDFDTICELGSGAYGRVSLARRKGESTLLALKEISKDATKMVQRSSHETNGQYEARCKARANKNLRWLLGERSTLEAVGHHPYLAGLRYAFETTTSWCLALDYAPGGDLFDLAYQQPDKRFSEAVTRVWMAELVCVLTHIHERHVIHRDIKLENLLLDLEGHVHLADFGFASRVSPGEKLSAFCGTKYYQCPESKPCLPAAVATVAHLLTLGLLRSAAGHACLWALRRLVGAGCGLLRAAVRPPALRLAGQEPPVPQDPARPRTLPVQDGGAQPAVARGARPDLPHAGEGPGQAHYAGRGSPAPLLRHHRLGPRARPHHRAAPAA